MIRDQSGGFVDGVRIEPSELEIAFGANHKESQGLMEPIKTLEIEVAAIQDVEGTRLRDEIVQDIDVVDFSLGIWINEGIEPRRSRSVWSLMAALCFRNLAHGKSERHRSIVVESKA